MWSRSWANFKEFPYIILFSTIWRYLAGYRVPYTISLVLLVGSQVLGLATPFVLGKLIDHIQGGITTRPELNHGLLLAGLYFAITPCIWLLHGPARVIERQAGFIVHRNYLEATYGRVRQLPYTWHQNFHSGQLVDRIKRSAGGLEGFTASQFVYLRFLTDFLGPLTILLWFFPWAGVACILMGSVAFFIVSRFDKHLIPLYKTGAKLSHEEIGVFTDYLANIRTIITLRLGKITQQELIQRYMARKEPFWRELRLNETKWGAISHAADFFVAMLIMLILVWMYHGSALKIGSIVMLIQYLTRFSSVFFNMGSMYQQMVQQAMSYRSALPIDEEFDRIQALPDFDVTESAPVEWHEIRFRDLNFSYKDKMNRPHALKNLNFELFRGEKVALVGPSGSGKSTLMTLLRGLYDAESVNLEIGGQNYDTLRVLREMTTLIPQDPEVFENTIRYNITFGVEHPEEEVAKACEIACFDTVLKGLALGMETDIREKGVNLSGGQRQRLALARGVFAIKESSIILLDEPTSSLDTATEGRVFDNLFQNFPNKTMVAAVHRLHLLPLFDRIIVLDQGQIIEQGNFSDLIKANGLLHDLWINYQHYNRSENAAQ
ncbi:MAG: msbA 1 [Alphaproteobacteria bacterium]|nr:msbA 1 [Alphaproteobacteria bacterium]